MAAELFWARRPLTYAGANLDRGQTLTLAGARNDEKLLRLGYLAQYEGKSRDLVTCDECGAKFISHDTRIGHHEKRHSGVALSPDQEDARLDREEKLLEAVAPLNLDQTAASRGA